MTNAILIYYSTKQYVFHYTPHPPPYLSQAPGPDSIEDVAAAIATIAAASELSHANIDAIQVWIPSISSSDTKEIHNTTPQSSPPYFIYSGFVFYS